MEAELEKIPAQIGTAVLDASDGRIVKVIFITHCPQPVKVHHLLLKHILFKLNIRAPENY